jgi:hypothetical protein
VKNLISSSSNLRESFATLAAFKAAQHHARVYSGPTHPNESVGTANPTPVVPRALDWNCLAHSRLRSSCRHHGDGGAGDDAGPEPQSRRLRHSRCRDSLAKPRPDCYRYLANPFAESPEAAGLKTLKQSRQARPGSFSSKKIGRWTIPQSFKFFEEMNQKPPEFLVRLVAKVTHETKSVRRKLKAGSWSWFDCDPRSLSSQS